MEQERQVHAAKKKTRYSSCRYNERQLIEITVVSRVRPPAGRWCDSEGHRRWKRAVGLFFAIDMLAHLLLNGTSLVTRHGAEDAHVRVPHPRALCYLYKRNLFLQPSLPRRRVSKGCLSCRNS